MFLKDKRFDKVIAIEIEQITMGRLLPILRSSSVRDIKTDDLEIRNTTINIGCKSKSVRAIMDAMASINELRWKQWRDGYELVCSNRELSIFDVDGDPYRKLKNDIGLKLIDQSKSLPQNIRQQLSVPPGITADQLPDSMYQSILQMIAAQLQQVPLGPGQSVLPLTQIPRDRVRFSFTKVSSSVDLNRYHMNYSSPAGGSGFNVTDYAQRRRQRTAETSPNGSRIVAADSGETVEIYETKRFSFPKADSRRLKELNAPVEIQLTNAHVYDVLYYLNSRYSVSFVCDSRKSMLQTRNINIRPCPLHEALDQVTNLFDKTEWEWRGLGFLIVRGPKNVARDPSNGQMRQTITR